MPKPTDRSCMNCGSNESKKWIEHGGYACSKACSDELQERSEREGGQEDPAAHGFLPMRYP